MVSDKLFAADLVESLEPLEVQTRSMFGEFAGKIRKGQPYPGAKEYFKISKVKMKETQWLRNLLELVETDLPEPKPKRKK